MSSTLETIVGQLPSLFIAGQEISLSFLRKGDRLGQRLTASAPDQAPVLLLESWEGTPAESWPASSPLQSLSIEELTPGNPVALLVGMAGKSHWSASIESLSSGTGWRWDVACRASLTPDYLGSTYLLGKDAAASATALAWQDVPGSLAEEVQTQQTIAKGLTIRITAEPLPASKTAPALRCSLQTAPDVMRLVAARQTAEGPTTFRWKYRVEVVPA